MASTRQLAPTKTDVGYAWIIVFATFFLQAIGDGVRFSYGLMFVEFLEEFQQGKGATAWIGSLMLGVLGNISEPYQNNNIEECVNEVNKEKLELNDTLTENTFKNKVLESLFPKKLVTNITFIILMFSTVFIAIPEFVPYSMLPDFGLSVNCAPSQTAWFLSVLGIGAMISNIAGGWLADLKCDLSLLGGCILTICALTMIIAVIPRLEAFFIYSALYGIFSAAMYGVQPIVLMEYFDEHSMASILGITMWVYGISGLIGTPAAGWLFDATGSFTVSFLATGACFVLSGLINFLVLCTKPHIELRK